jgi:hypothetical protein
MTAMPIMARIIPERPIEGADAYALPLRFLPTTAVQHFGLRWTAQEMPFVLTVQARHTSQKI